MQFNDAILVEMCICPLRNLFAKKCMCCSTLAVYDKDMAMLDCIEGRVGDTELRLIEFVESHMAFGLVLLTRHRLLQPLVRVCLLVADSNTTIDRAYIR